MDISDLLDYVDRELNLADTEAQEIYAALLRLQDIDNTKLPEPDYLEAQDFEQSEFVVSRKDYDALAERLAAAEARANYNGAEWVKSAEGILALQAKLKALTAAASVVLDNCGTVVVSSDEGTSYYADDALRDAILREAEELK